MPPNTLETEMLPQSKPTHRETIASTSVSVSDGAADRYIPPDIVFEILSRLPVKYVLRFQCVCKDWRTITSQEPFISAHLSRSSSSLLVHAMEMDYGFHGMCSISLPASQSTFNLIDIPRSDAAQFDPYLKVIGSLPNGVVCVSQNLFSDKLILWNPATRSTRSIIAPKLIPDPNIHTGSSIGLAYDPSLDDIKIVRMLCHDASAEPDLVEFYSLNSGEWKIMKKDEIPQFYVAEFGECDTVFEGVPYWKCSMYDEELGERHMLLSFLPKEGSFDVESIDRIWTIDSWTVCMGEIKGHLAAVSWGILETREDMWFQMLDVWLKCEDSIWKKLYRVGPLPAIGRVLGILGEKLFVQECYKEGLRLYDLKKKDVTPFFTYNKNRVAAECYRVVTYKESLSRIPEAGCSLKRSPSTI